MPWINGQSSGTRIGAGGGSVVVNADGGVSIAPASGTGLTLDGNLLRNLSYLSLPAGWDTAWRAAKAAVSGSPALVTIIGDSISQGFNASDFLNKGWAGLLTTALQAKYGAGATYYGVHASAAPNGASSPYNGTPPWVFASAYGGQRRGPAMATGAAGATGVMPWATFTTPAACTDLDLVYMDTGGSFQWAVDGGAAATLTLGTTNHAARLAMLTGGAATTHVVTLGNQSVTQALVACGIVCYQSRTSGVAVANCGYAGASLYDYCFANSVPTDRIAQFQGKAAATTGFGFPTQPHLAILAMGVNDCTFGNGIVGYRKLYARLCQALRRGQPNASLLFLIPCNADPVSSDASGFGNGAFWHLYMGAIYDIAREFGAAVVNIHAKWGETPFASGYIGGGNAHPVDAGHADIAATLEGIL